MFYQLFAPRRIREIISLCIPLGHLKKSLIGSVRPVPGPWRPWSTSGTPGLGRRHSVVHGYFDGTELFQTRFNGRKRVGDGPEGSGQNHLQELSDDFHRLLSDWTIFTLPIMLQSMEASLNGWHSLR